MSRADEELVRQRLAVLELAEELGNVSEACRRRGMSRCWFYRLRQRYEAHGLEGLVNLSRAHKSHPQTTPPERVEQVLALSNRHPRWGCKRLAEQIELEGWRLSNVTIQRLLIEHGRGRCRDRLPRLGRGARRPASGHTPLLHC